MGAAYFPSFDRDVPGVSSLDGKMIARNSDALGVAAERLGVAALDSFAGHVSDEELADLGLGPEEVAELAGKGNVGSGWFKPSAGLATVKALLADVRRRGKAYAKPDALVEDLEGLAGALRAAAKARARFCLKVDI